MTRVDESASFARFVYPFLFDAGTFDARVGATEGARWQGRDREFAMWSKESFPDFDLLPHVARYLNPPPDTLPSARLWELGNDALQSLVGLGAQADWKLMLPKSQEIPFRFRTVQLRLFRVGVGFLTVRAEPETAEVAGWLDFMHYFRFAWGARNVGVRAHRQGRGWPVLPRARRRRSASRWRGGLRRDRGCLTAHGRIARGTRRGTG